MDKLIVLIGEIDNRINLLFTNDKIINNSLDIYNNDRTIIYHYPEYKSKLLMELLIHPKKPIELYSNFSKAVNIYIQTKINLEFNSIILPRIKELETTKLIKQKSIGWLVERDKIIAASEAGYLLGIKGISAMINYIENKCGISDKLECLQYVKPIIHGVIYEPVSRNIYATRNSVNIQEYGLIISKDNANIGASPDGIITQCKNDNNLSLLGRLLEIKNPYSWDDKNDIKVEYMIQILQQQYVLKIPICVFVKTHIVCSDYNKNAEKEGYKQYKCLDDMLNDTISNLNDTTTIHNFNIPQENLSHLGQEKGLLIFYYTEANGIRENETLVYPLNIKYNKVEILKWIDENINKLVKNGIPETNISVKYWYLVSYYDKTYIYDKKLYETIYLPRLNLIWQIICKIKEFNNNLNIMKSKIAIVKKIIQKPSKFYKDSKNQDEIIKILNDALININKDLVIDNDNDRNIDNDKTIDINKDNKVYRNFKVTRNTIELDF